MAGLVLPQVAKQSTIDGASIKLNILNILPRTETAQNGECQSKII
jgi:hypothetical protein